MRYELIHDSLAKQIFAKASSEARMRRKIEKHVRESYQAFKDRGARLTQDDIEYIQPYLANVALTQDELDFIDHAKKSIKRKRNQLRAIVISVVLALAALTFWALISQVQARNQAKIAGEKSNEANIARDSANIARDSANMRLKRARLSDSLADLSAQQAVLERDRAIAAQLAADQSATEANIARDRAEKRTKAAESLRLAAELSRLGDVDLDKALRLGQAAFDQTYPDNPPADVFLTLTNTFYKQGIDGVPSPVYHLNVKQKLGLQTVGFLDNGELLGYKGKEGEDDMKIVIFDVNGKILKSIDKPKLREVILSPSKTVLLSNYGDSVNWQNLENAAEFSQMMPSWPATVMFSDDEQFIFALLKHEVMIWNIDGTDKSTFSLPSEPQWAKIFSEGNRILTVHRQDYHSILWDIDSNEIARLPVCDQADILGDSALLLDGRDLFGIDGKRINVLAPQSLIGTGVSSIASDGSICFVSTGVGGSFFTSDGVEIGILDQDDKNLIKQAKFLPNLKHLIVCTFKLGVGPTEDYPIIYSSDGKQLMNLEHEWVTDLFTTNHPPMIHTYSKDDLMKTWDVNGGLLSQHQFAKGAIDAIEVSPDGMFILSKSEVTGSTLWPLKTPLIKSFNIAEELIISSEYDDEKNLLLALTKDKYVKLFDSEGQNIATVSHDELPIIAIGFIPKNVEGEDLFLSADKKMIKIWNRKEEIEYDFRLPEAKQGKKTSRGTGFHDIEISPKSQLVTFSAHEFGTWIWDFKKDQMTQIALPYKRPGRIEYSPDGEIVILKAPFGGDVVLCDEQGVISDSIERVKHIVYSEKGEIEMVISYNDQPETFQSKRSFEVLGESDFPLGAGSIFGSSIDGKLLVVRHDWDRKLIDWNGNVLSVFTEFGRDPENLSFSADNQMILVRTKDEVTVWNQRAELLIRIPTEKMITDAKFVDGDRYVLVFESGGSVKFWPTAKSIINWLKNDALIPDLTRDDSISYRLLPDFK